MPEPEVPDDSTAPEQVTIELDGRTETTDYRPGTTILQTARQMGMAPPFSCEAGQLRHLHGQSWSKARPRCT